MSDQNQPDGASKAKSTRSRKARTEATQDRRKQRTPMGGFRLKMDASVYERPGFKLRWMNGDEGRIQQALAAGYTFVLDPNKSNQVGEGTDSNTEMGAAISMVTDKREGKRSYLMEIPEEFYLEDYGSEQAQVDEIEDAIKGGTSNENVKAEQDAFYRKAGHGLKVE